MAPYFRPIPSTDVACRGLALAGGWSHFDQVEVLERGRAPEVIPAGEVPPDWIERLTAPRAPIARFNWSRPVIMGILNATPDSFSDGGTYRSASAAAEAAVQMERAGADIVDIGGESTRPGAELIADDVEIARTAPVIAAARAAGVTAMISIDTRKSAVAAAALDAGANTINDVSGLTYDAALAPMAAERNAPVCVMHMEGTPQTMQQDPQYDDVLLDVYDALQARIDAVVAAGVSRAKVIADPGIGFAKTLDHNFAILRRISLFHGLGVPLLLGVSRKRFIGTVADVAEAHARAPGSIAVAQQALNQGVQVLRVHDVAETTQAVALWRTLVANA